MQPLLTYAQLRAASCFSSEEEGSARCMNLFVPTKCLVGESLVWDSEGGGALWWLDINGKQLFRLDWGEQTIECKDLPRMASALALRHSGGSKVRPDLPLLLAFEDGFYLYDHRTGEEMKISTPYVQSNHKMRLNDGRCDRQGRFICGGINLENVDGGLEIWRATQAVYQVNSAAGGKGSRELLPGPYRCYNSTCFSPSGTTMYMSDTPLGIITAYDYDAATGTPSNPRDFVRVASPGKPDGATCDAEGGLWVAEFWAGRVTHYSSAGERIASYSTPGAMRTTCCCIGGPNMDILFCTSACVGLSEDELLEQPAAGGLFAMVLLEENDPKGCLEPRFTG